MKRLSVYFCALLVVMFVGSLTAVGSYAQGLNDQMNGMMNNDTTGNAIRGVVINAQTSQPVADAIVQVEGAQVSDTTDSAGTFTLTGVSGEGSHTLNVTADGFQDYSKKIDLGKKMQNQTITIRLKPEGQ